MATILVCLNACAMNVSQELSDTILQMVQNCNLMTRPRTVGVGLVSQIGFPGPVPAPASEGPLGNISSNLNNLNLGGGGVGGVSSSIFPTPVSSSMGFGGIGSIGTAPGSPGRPLGPSAAPGTSQSPLSSILPSLPLGPTLPVAPVGSQLPALPASSSLPSALRSHSVQPTVAPPRQMDMSQIFNMPQSVSKEVEDEANSYFQRIYNHPPHPTLSIEEVLDMLKKFHESSSKREREVYSCMLRNLFEEYRFFPTYPDKELFTTARLFGGIIEQGLVEYMALGVALRYVMEALQKPHGSKMYYFGIVALDRFRSRLKEYPRYCQHLMAIQHFNEFQPHLIELRLFGWWDSQTPTPSSEPNSPLVATCSSGFSTSTTWKRKPSPPAPSATVQEVLRFWETARIPTMTAKSAVRKVEVLFKDWKALVKSKGRATNKTKEEEFQEALCDLFDVAHAERDDPDDDPG
ncbi:CCR4-NOT transcription complex subunit 1 [Chionoecetes opilio]|uniref:CCR4-NOT transcription complex subunit 1 n=1 Tax=Chionoecetes opilio TaxID=41210 RepID=A0A8J5D2R5_CHIOP|nr:CCR4-NOT transcription complex subunit 1 [Chionoecetes opilio]